MAVFCPLRGSSGHPAAPPQAAASGELGGEALGAGCWGDERSQRGVSPPLWFPGLAQGCALPSSPLATPLSSEGEAGPCENSLLALNPRECLPGRTAPLGIFAFLPVRLCRAQQETGGQHSLRLGTTVGEAHWLQEPLLWCRRRRGWQPCPVITGECWEVSSTAATERETQQAVPAQTSGTKVSEVTQSP